MNLSTRSSVLLGTALVTASCGLRAVAAEALTVTVQIGQPGPAISPTLFGVFFEDINFGADGGLAAELVKNKGFEFPDPLMGWSKSGGPGTLTVLDQDPFAAANPHYLRLQADTRGFGVINDGFRGMGVKKSGRYRLSFQARSLGSAAPRLQADLLAPDGSVLASGSVGGVSSGWKQHSLVLTAKAAEAKSRLRLTLGGPGSVDLDWVSLVPADTWKRRPDGLRADLVQALADLKPGFMRFPGGCIVEGHYLSNRYQWKTTIGDPAGRKLIVNRWNDEIKHRPTPDYFQSFGLGFFEYFRLCEDIGAEPLPVLNCGMACQFNSGELVPLDQLDPYIQDALDLIEFANGSTTSPWGARRAAMGHPAPFGLKLLGVGNEQWGPQYLERYARFAGALKARHPEVKLVSSAGPGPADDKFQFAWPKLRELRADIVDEHCYARPDWFFSSAGRYDHYDRGGPKVFMGEYAAQSVAVVSPDNRNTWECALSEAAFLTGLERNADVVTLSSYAPLFAHVEAWQWTPDLIWFDNLRVARTPSYYVQQLFSRNRGSQVLPALVNGSVTNGTEGLYVVAARGQRRGDVILTLVNARPQIRTATIDLSGARSGKLGGEVTVLASEDLTAENRVGQPERITPMKRRLGVGGPSFPQPLPANSVTVLRLSGVTP